MNAPRTLRKFRTDDAGAAGMEFALVSIMFLGLMLGTIDMARLMWELNSAKAATRAATRLAIVSEPVAQDLVEYDAVSALSLTPGAQVPAGAVSNYVCTESGCNIGSENSTAFDEIYAAMQAHYSRLQPENVVVEYRSVGLGFAGNPYGPDVEPLVTVRLCTEADSALDCAPVEFAPGVLQAFGLDPFDMPSVASSLTGEDLSFAAGAS